MGTLVVFADEIYAARFVRKAHTQAVSPFQSSPVGPIGWLSRGRGADRSAAGRAAAPRARRGDEPPPVALITFGAGEEGLLVDAVARAGYRGSSSRAPAAAMSPPAPCQSSSAWRR